MRLPNGFGSVYKLKGNRRKPYRACLSNGYTISNGKSKINRITLGYYSTKKDAIAALTNYHENPYDIKTEIVTFKELYERWSEDHFKKLANKSSIRTYTAAFKHSAPLHKMRFKDIRPNHLESTIKDANVGDATKSRMKSMYNMLYRYALKYDIIDKNYAELCDGIKVEKLRHKTSFTQEEIKQLWQLEEENFPFADMILFAIYSGFRPIEMTMIKTKDIYLDKGYIIGGTKTAAGKNRVVPIHSKIKKIVENRYDINNEFLFMDYNMMERKVSKLTYDKYRGRFEKVMLMLKTNHTPHETRHSFITYAKKSDINEYMLKQIIGHEIRDITEKVYTHRTIEELCLEMEKINFL